jgi:hypothetical protein
VDFSEMKYYLNHRSTKEVKQYLKKSIKQIDLFILNFFFSVVLPNGLQQKQ